MEFPATQRNEMLSLVLAEALADQEQASLAHQDIGSRVEAATG
jgi:hypothetical protein